MTIRARMSVGLLIIALFAVPSVALAQAGYIGLFFDPAGTMCSIDEQPNLFVPIYAIHMATAGAGAVQFGVEAGNPSGFIFLGETSPYATIIGSVWIHDEGNGGSVAYGSCVASPNLVKTVNVLTTGTNPPCTPLTVIPDPASLTGTIEVVDCDNNKLIGGGGHAVVDPDESCPWVCYVPVQESTWGGVKALYR